MCGLFRMKEKRHCVQGDKELLEEFKLKIESGKAYIYGAAKVAGAVFDILKSMNIDIIGFVVNSRENNPEEYCGFLQW